MAALSYNIINQVIRGCGGKHKCGLVFFIREKKFFFVYQKLMNH